MRVANEKAEEIIRPGVRLCDIDLTARNYISSFGYGEYFTHRLDILLVKQIMNLGM